MVSVFSNETSGVWGLKSLTQDISCHLQFLFVNGILIQNGWDIFFKVSNNIIRKSKVGSFFLIVHIKRNHSAIPKQVVVVRHVGDWSWTRRGIQSAVQPVMANQIWGHVLCTFTHWKVIFSKTLNKQDVIYSSLECWLFWVKYIYYLDDNQ